MQDLFKRVDDGSTVDVVYYMETWAKNIKWGMMYWVEQQKKRT